jgi:UDP-N-acetyl-D-mannosaminuronate dehydrogenase
VSSAAVHLPTDRSLAGRWETGGHRRRRDPGIVDAVNSGGTSFAEPDLWVAVGCAQREMRQADAYVIADPPPFAGDHRADLSSIMGAAEAIAGVLRGGEVFMI